MVVVTTGTFLGGRIWVGNKSIPAGRAGEFAAEGLTETLNQLGFETGRLKTGTPARVDKRSVDYRNLEIQPGDEQVADAERDGEEQQQEQREIIRRLVVQSGRAQQQVMLH